MPRINPDTTLTRGVWICTFLGVLLAGPPAYAINGDINADGMINVSDVQCVVLAALDITPEDPSTTPACLPSMDSVDFDCSNGISVVDVQISVQIVLSTMLGGNGIPANQDLDGDEILAGCDICPDDYNPNQLDSDSDGLGDLCDPTPVECGQAQVTCPGAAAPAWTLENVHPDTAGYGDSFGLDTYQGGVLVVILLAAS